MAVSARDETEHASEQNFRCFVLSALPHSTQVFGIGGCIPCHARREPTALKWASEEREAAEARAAQERDIERRRQAGWG